MNWLAEPDWHWLAVNTKPSFSLAYSEKKNIDPVWMPNSFEKNLENVIYDYLLILFSNQIRWKQYFRSGLFISSPVIFGKRRTLIYPFKLFSLIRMTNLMIDYYWITILGCETLFYSSLYFYVVYSMRKETEFDLLNMNMNYWKMREYIVIVSSRK